MLSLRLHANPDKVCYRNCYALSNILQSAPMQTYVKDMSILPLVVDTAATVTADPPPQTVADEPSHLQDLLTAGLFVLTSFLGTV